MIHEIVAPTEPLGPPPSSRKVPSRGAIVRPEARVHAKPRQTSSPPSVTMNDGIPTKATRKPWRPPMSAPTRSPAASAMIQVSG